MKRKREKERVVKQREGYSVFNMQSKTVGTELNGEQALNVWSLLRPVSQRVC